MWTLLKEFYSVDMASFARYNDLLIYGSALSQHKIHQCMVLDTITNGVVYI